MRKLVVSFTCGTLLMGGILFTNNVQGKDKPLFEPKPTAII